MLVYVSERFTSSQPGLPRQHRANHLPPTTPGTNNKSQTTSIPSLPSPPRDLCLHPLRRAHHKLQPATPHPNAQLALPPPIIVILTLTTILASSTSCHLYNTTS